LRQYSENKLKRILDDVREKLGLDKSVRLYDATRQSVASQLVNRGVSLFSILKLLSHSNIKMTEWCSHVDLEKLKVGMKNISLIGATVTKVAREKKAISQVVYNK